ncbi:hypothetical protein A0H81_14701 [Grifola frondosa]|uniref:Oxidoreductase YusZ n=1 Tax=Grifola frondosa TaxID=5627 RepID=A0A1C7LM67_GRIFR|nr:hypothetical protein A0H81_14701 [Grifola frondosa]
MSESKQLVWLITGTSTGIGRCLTLAALKRGDRVIATARARSISQLADLQAQGADVLQLDVTDTPDNLKEIAKKAVAIHGRVDVVVNNAGYAIISAIEEYTQEESLQQFNTNFFGGLNIARAFLPYMRERKSGTILWIGSVAGWTQQPSFGMYSSTKYAIRGISETLDAEIAHLGLRSITVELGYFNTNVIPNRIPYVNRIADYQNSIVTQTSGFLDGYHGHEPGDPIKGAEAIADLVHGEGFAGGREIPPTVGFGSDYLIIYFHNPSYDVRNQTTAGLANHWHFEWYWSMLNAGCSQARRPVIATARARSITQLADLATQGADILQLDVTDSLDNIKKIAKKAIALHGRVDVVVNNAGYAVIGGIEECTPEESLQQFNTNFFGALNVARAFLPYMRERRSGTIVWIGSVAAWTPSVSFGIYSATKYAMRGLSETLNTEIAHLGLRSITVELGYFRTNMIVNRTSYVNRIADYKEVITKADKYLNHEPGDPAKAGEAIVDLVRGEGLAKEKQIRTTIGLGSDYYVDTTKSCEGTRTALVEWESFSRSTDF